MLLDVIGQRAQAAENALVVGVIGAQLESVALGNRKCKLERIDGIEAQIAAEQRRVGIDRLGFDPVDIQALHDELGELMLGGSLCGGGWRIHLQATCDPLWGGKKAAQCIIRAAAHTARHCADSVSQLFVPSVIPERSASLPPLRVGYARDSVADLLAQADVLAVIRFDSTASGIDDPRYLRVGLDVIGDSVVEVWRGDGTILHGRDGLVRWSTDGNYGYFAVEVEEAERGIEAAAEQAYGALTGVVRASATPHVLRLWNYFDAINLGDGDDERYRRFCVGRARAMGDTWQDRYPAATAIGRRDGVRVLQVYALAARRPGVAVENPRQVNAWRYPREYGPTPPTFARGMTTPAGQLLISGTAAVVGAKSRHVDDVAAQLEETLTNISSLIGTASVSVTTAPGAGSLLKVYVRDPADAAMIATRLRGTLRELDGLLILNGDICRRELLVEIDGLHI